MFCSNCGNELREGLNYCNRCGVRTEIGALEKIEAALPIEQNKLAQTLSMSLGWIGFAGLIALAIMIGTLLRKDFIHPAQVFLVVVFSALVFGIMFIIVRQISNLSGRDSNRAPRRGRVETTGSQIFPQTENTSQLPPFREPVASVTEHTTRAFSETFAEKTKP